MLRILLSSALITPGVGLWWNFFGKHKNDIHPKSFERESQCPTYSKNVGEFANLGYGNFAVPENRGIDFFVKFAPSDADFKNTFGVYFEDDKCNPLGGEILYKDFKAQLREQYRKSQPKIKETVQQADVPRGATQFGYFVIPDGGRVGKYASKVLFEKKATANGKSMGYKAFYENDKGEKVYLKARTSSLEVVFTKAHLNPWFTRMVLGEGKEKKIAGHEGSEQLLRFEDGGYGGFNTKGGEIDFNDVVAKVGVRSEVKPQCEKQQAMCGNNGYCDVHEGAIKCKCTDGYTGDACKIAPTTEKPEPAPTKEKPEPAPTTEKPEPATEPEKPGHKKKGCVTNKGLRHHDVQNQQAE